MASSSRVSLQETLHRAARVRAFHASFGTLGMVPIVEEYFPYLPLYSFFENPRALERGVRYEGDPRRIGGQPRIAVLQHPDILDPTVSWQRTCWPEGVAPLANLNDPNSTTNRICLINGAHDDKPGGEWLSGICNQEESIARRSTLYHALTNPAPGELRRSFYPLEGGGIYSPNVVVHRAGPEEHYEPYACAAECTVISVVSVAPERAPMLDGDGNYLFDIERELQRFKMALALRLAAIHRHRNIVIGMFGSVNREIPEYTTRKGNMGGGIHGQGPRVEERRDINPIREVSALWVELLDNENSEFYGLFDSVVFICGMGVRAEADAHCLTRAFRLPAINEIARAWYPEECDGVL